jgi:hypothetical protein
MKICTVWGNLLSEKSSENYPTDLYCEDCFNEMNPDGEDSQIISYQDDDSSYGDVCAGCGKTEDEENEELGIEKESDNDNE